MTPTYAVDYWYRHESDDDRSVRTHCQMCAHANTETDVRTEITNLQSHRYTVQRVIMRLNCPTCEGAGRLAKRPKGVRKTTVLPAWRLVYSTCPTCQGDGWVDAAELTIAPVAPTVHSAPFVELVSSETAYGRTVGYDFAVKVF